MISNDLPIHMLRWIVFSIPQIIIIVACFMYISKKSDADGILMLIGAIIGFLVQGFHSILPILNSREILSYTEITPIITIVSVIGFIGAICFAIGLLMLVQKVLKKTS